MASWIGLLLFLFGTGRILGDASSNSFPNEVAAGDITTNSAVLWTHATVLGPVRFTLSTNAALNPVQFETETNATDALLPVKVAVSNLVPGMQYYYQVTDSAAHAAAGQFRTPFAPGTFHGLRFGVSGDWRGELAPYPSVANAPAAGLDLFVELGDTIYADYPSPALLAPQAKTLADFRTKHNEVYSARFGLNALADLRRSTAILAVLDDHEVLNNFAGGAPPSSDARFDTNGAFINETVLYRTATRAFQEFNPVREELYRTPGDPRTDGKPKLYRTQTYGSDGAIFLLDARSFRDAELPSVSNPLDSTEVKAFNDATFDLDAATGQPLARRTMLGAQQLADLKADLLQAKAQGILWKFVLIGEPIQNLGFADGPDRFEGYGAERADLLQFITEHQIRNVVFISADIHGTVINNVEDQLGPNQPLVPTGTFEVVTGPVAYDKPFGPTAFDAAAAIEILPGLTLLQGLLNYVGVPSRAAYEALPLSEQDRLFKQIMDVQLNAIGLDPTGLEGSDIAATLLVGGYVAVHTYGWTKFVVDPENHGLTVTTFGIVPYAPDQVDATLLARTPAVMSRFSVWPSADPPNYPALAAARTGGQMRISWPQAATNFVLRTRTALANASWQNVTNVPSISGDEQIVRIATTGRQAFFRLEPR
jgi:alkaline phosphatase D